MKDILKAIATLLKVKNLVILIIVGATIYFAYVGKIEISVITGAFTVVISNFFDDRK